MVAGQPVHLKYEVILKEEEADDGEEVDQDEGQQGGQQDGAAVSGHTLDDVEQCLFAVDEVKELWGRNEDTAGPTGCLLPAGSHIPQRRLRLGGWNQAHGPIAGDISGEPGVLKPKKKGPRGKHEGGMSIKCSRRKTVRSLPVRTLYKTIVRQLTSSSQLFWKTGAVNEPFYR